MKILKYFESLLSELKTDDYVVLIEDGENDILLPSYCISDYTGKMKYYPVIKIWTIEDSNAHNKIYRVRAYQKDIKRIDYFVLYGTEHIKRKATPEEIEKAKKYNI